MRVAVARRTGQVVEMVLRLPGRHRLLRILMTLRAEDRLMRSREWKARILMACKSESGRLETVHRVTALATIPVASTGKLALVHILVAGGAGRIVPTHNPGIAATMFRMAVFASSP